MPVGSCRKHGSNCRSQQDFFAPKTKINPAAILRALDRKIREQEKQEHVRKDYLDAVARRTPSAPTNRRPVNRKQPAPKQHQKKPKGILRKPCKSEHEIRCDVSDFFRDNNLCCSPYAPRKGFSMYEIESGLSDRGDSMSFYLDSKPYQQTRSPPRVRFEKVSTKKGNSASKGKNTKYTCHNNSIRFSENPSHFTNYPEYNVSSNKDVSYDLNDITSKWSDFGCGKDFHVRRNRSRSSECKGSDDYNNQFDFSTKNVLSDKYDTDKFKFDSPNKYNYDIFNLDASVYSNYKLKHNVPYYNPNFEKIDNLIRAPLSNIDALINKYGSQSQYSSSSTDPQFSSSNHQSFARSYSRDLVSIKSGHDLVNSSSAVDRNVYLSKHGQFTSPSLQQPRGSQISISSSGSYGNFHNDEELHNFSENNQVSANTSQVGSPVRQSKVSSYPTSYNNTPNTEQKNPGNVGYLDPQENDQINENSESHRGVSGSDVDGERTITPTEQSSKISLDLNEAHETVDESDLYYPECKSPQKEKREETSQASSVGSSSPIVFESSSTSYEDLINKYKATGNISSNISHAWMPQSKVLKNILEDEYDGPYSRNKRFEMEEREKQSKYSYLEKSERCEMDNIQDLINLVNGNLSEVEASDSEQKERTKEFDISELRSRISKFALERL